MLRSSISAVPFLAAFLVSDLAVAQVTLGPAAGDGAWGMPALVRVGVPDIGERRFALALDTGYGFTESQPDEHANHHRFIGTIAGAIRPRDWLTVGLRVDGRYDRHPYDDLGKDDGWVGDPRIAVRLAHLIGPGLRLGVEGRALFPGEEAPSIVWDATTLEGLLLGSYSTADGALTAAAQAGFRRDLTYRSVEDPSSLRQGDWIALGTSDFNEVLLGAGAAYRTGSIEVLGEVSSDLLVGKGHPRYRYSPIRGTLGVRYALTPELGVDVSVQGVASKRPDIDASAPLIPIEPRVMALVGLRYALSLEPPPPPPLDDEHIVPQPPNVTPPPTHGNLHGSVVGEDGGPVAGAHVMVAPPGEGTQATEVVTDEGGQFSVSDLPVGDVRVAVTAEGFENAELTVQVAGGDAPTEAPFRLVRAVPPGQIRGLIRSFSGENLQATIRVQPLGTELQTSADGQFELNVPPGEYDVVISAPGYDEQQRHVVVEERGVTVINADLRRSP